jgi:hypothetical protein
LPGTADAARPKYHFGQGGGDILNGPEGTLCAQGHFNGIDAGSQQGFCQWHRLICIVNDHHGQQANI